MMKRYLSFAALILAALLMLTACSGIGLPSETTGSGDVSSSDEVTTDGATTTEDVTTEEATTEEVTTEEVTTEAPEVTDEVTTEAPVVTDEPTDAPEATDAPEQTTAPSREEKGCGGMIAGAVAVIALLGTAIVFKKKD